GVDENKISSNNLGNYFDLRLYSEQLEGMFADTIILVEGLTEKLAIPIWLERKKYFLSANGIEIINCMGKANIPTLYRLYKSFGYRCICIFDGDINKKNLKDRKNKLFEDILEDFEESKIYTEDKKRYHYIITGTDYVCFGQDYETTIKNQLGEENYVKLKEEATAYNLVNKQGIAKYIAKNSSHIPIAIDKLIEVLYPKINEEGNEDYHFDDEIPF
ncbi:MAG: ATP-dependent endonuclease, partial [Peptoniphilus sp.]|nr:ATP-dependent endonuclease [Peptoniphilus sp.]